MKNTKKIQCLFLCHSLWMFFLFCKCFMIISFLKPFCNLDHFLSKPNILRIFNTRLRKASESRWWKDQCLVYCKRCRSCVDGIRTYTRWIIHVVVFSGKAWKEEPVHERKSRNRRGKRAWFIHGWKEPWCFIDELLKYSSCGLNKWMKMDVPTYILAFPINHALTADKALTHQHSSVVLLRDHFSTNFSTIRLILMQLNWSWDIEIVW